ncbi:MAG TPA: uracil-DNA glycosylase [Vitreimonas sp.]|uniref:uracil-DNA glycosylase n=1 Tax=Vitreimonas sp. TaxID=3069702 RepID=UPI002D5D1D05|nr:uracil-DNA glycosylase [Vitreimonas sp.]HYD86467.1 uracil-DNA glycosylase [Vitreimonas sp.]
MAAMNAPEPPIQVQAAARALLAFWRAAGVDMDEAEAVYAATARPAPARRPAAPAATPIAPRPAPKVRAKASSAVDNAGLLAKAAQSVAGLRAAVEGFDGCALKATARNTVFSDGVDDAPVLIIGEAPGKDEDEQGRPFVGRSGQLLDRMLATIGLSRQSNVLISNTIYWRPPGNRDPTPGEILTCLPFVERLIELKQPKLLILAGKAAANTVLKRDEAVTRLRGRRLSYNREGLAAPINTMVMLHPAYLLRRPQEKRLAWADLLAAESWLDELGVARIAQS